MGWWSHVDTLLGRLKVTLCVVLMWACITLVASLPPSISYNVSPLYANHLVAKGKILSMADVYSSVAKTKPCHCRTACWMDSRCVAVAEVSDNEGPMYCHLSDKGPTSSTVLDDALSTYIFWQDSLPSGNYSMWEDNMLYLIVPKWMNFTSAKALCAQIPGHRLAITKSVVQYNALDKMALQTGFEMWVDLTKASEMSPVVWGDGEEFAKTGAATVEEYLQNGLEFPVAFRTYTDILDDKSLSHKAYPLCQANPMGLDW
ncbi:uncharacterized protein LOC121858892 [Homarus americanus]|uniref:uncharacterized protein LOC121858892 n=1 Tax=Homarus americanus TaxID=6706 RepID=UPI001C4607B9|nr:uncharacterized protein LOC121858892 [Homarus americanus]